MFEELGGRLSELAAQLENAMQPGRFNRDSQYRQFWRHVASTPFALRPGLSSKDMKRTKEKTTRKRERTNEKV